MKSSTEKRTEFAIIATTLIWFFWAGAAALDHVGRYQLDAVYSCAIDFSEAEHAARCRNELDGFGSLIILTGAK